MKRTIATALFAVATLTGAAYAATPSEATLSQIQDFVPFTDLSGLTDVEAQNILSIIHGGESDGEKRSLISGQLK